MQRGLGFRGFPKIRLPTIMETQMEKRMENEIERLFFGVWGWGFRVSGLGFRAEGSEFRVWRVGLKD